MTRYTPQWLQAGSYAASVDRRLLGALWPLPASSGCAVSPASAMTVNVAAGQVAVPSQNNTGTSLCSSDAVEAVTLTAAPASGTNRIDVITCHPRGNDLDGGSNNDFIFDFVTGTAAATPTVPATPAGQVALAQIYVPGGSAAVTAANITDVRPFGLSVAGAQALPPPTTSATVVSFTDDNLEVWVAKAGVNGGNWRKARDVLHCRYYRNGTWTPQTTAAAITFDAAVNDTYGIYSGGTFTAPITGFYRIAASLAATATATGQWLSTRLIFGGVIWGNGSYYSGGAASMGGPVELVNLFTAGQTVTVQEACSTASLTGATGQDKFFSVDYLGTG